MYHKASKKRLRTIILPSGRGMLIQRLDCGLMAICGPVSKWGTVEYERAKWFSFGSGRRTGKAGGKWF